MAETPGVRYAGFFPRLAAWLVDLIIVFSICVVLVVAFRLGLDSFGLMYLMIAVPYEVLFLAVQGATFGKMALGLTVVAGDWEAPLGFVRAFQRVLWKSVIPIILGPLLIFFDEKSQAAHDKLAGTYVIYKDSMKYFRNPPERRAGPSKQKTVIVPSKGNRPPLEVVYEEPRDES